MSKRFVYGVLLLAAAVLMYVLGRPDSPTPRANAPLLESREDPAPVTAPATPPSAKREPVTEEVPPLAAQPNGNTVSPPPTTTTPVMATPEAAEAPAPEEPLANVDPEIDLEEVRRMVRGFRDVLGENPVGNNSEITRALTGGNLRQVKMPVPRGSKINEEGELTDRWGTPYFFHQISTEEMEVRSAGPDRVMWTADDHQVN